MDVADTVLVELATLLCGPLHAQLHGLFVSLALDDFLGQRLGDVAVESLGHYCQLAQLGKRLDAGHDGDGNAHLAGFLNELEVLLVVKEQLRDGILRPQVLLLLQILHVALQVGRLFVLLGIAGHTEVELRTGMLDRCAVGKEALVEPDHLTDEVGGMGMTALGGCEACVLLSLVATQQHEVADAQKLQVQQLVLRLFNGGATADDVWLDGYVIAVLDGCGNSYGSWPAADALTLELAIVQLAIDVLGVVGSDIDEGRVQFGQFVNSGKQRLSAVALQRWQYLEREATLVRLRVVDIVCYGHICLC